MDTWIYWLWLKSILIVYWKWTWATWLSKKVKSNSTMPTVTNTNNIGGSGIAKQKNSDDGHDNEWFERKEGIFAIRLKSLYTNCHAERLFIHGECIFFPLPPNSPLRRPWQYTRIVVFHVLRKKENTLRRCLTVEHRTIGDVKMEEKGQALAFNGTYISLRLVTAAHHRHHHHPRSTQPRGRVANEWMDE